MAETRRISTLIESQLPEFISSDYENFSRVVEKYYEQLELRGQPLDVIQNIAKYRDIDFYEKNLLAENTTLSSNVSSSDTTIVVADASSFPQENGYIKIGDEILFYKSRSADAFFEVTRGVSGNTKLGDLYEKSNFVTTLATDHNTGAVVHNISNLFLYAIVKNFESDYLASFPEKYLNEKVDKRTLIKNISSFYRAKGTDRSIKFIFNTLVSNDKPEVIKPKEFTTKASTSDWVTSYSLKVKVLSGDPTTLVGNEVIQQIDPFQPSNGYASAIVDNVFSAGTVDGEQLYEIALDTSSINNTFSIAAKTELTESFQGSTTVGDRINVFSTEGFLSRGRILIGTEEIEYIDKNINQFVISKRTSTQIHQVGSDVYTFSTVTSGSVKLLVLGVLYNLNPSVSAPYSEEGDFIEVSDPGFVTRDPIIMDRVSNQPRWILSQSKASSLNAVITSQISNLNADVSAVYEDSNYYYICSSSFPSRPILLANTQESLQDQKTMRLIRKRPQVTTEAYETTQRDVGILVDGTLAFSYRDFSQVKSGVITKFTLEDKGSGYADAPNVLINNIPGRARCFLAGETVDRIELLDQSSYTEVPRVTLVSGRGAKASATVTFGRITSLQVLDQGEYYSTPPVVRIVDRLGKGRFAEYTAVLENGKVVGFEQVDEGKFYSKGNVVVDILPVGSGATATCDIVTWTKDRYANLGSKLDASNGYAFQNYNPTKGFGYGVVANPVQLREELNDDGSNHSPILGYAYDGNPIYGPFGFINPLDAGSAVARLRSGYHLKSNRLGGPNPEEFSLGTFIEDYEWRPSTQTGKLELDENNGRFCVTPEYPDGVYAYFVSIDADGDPAFPYILGQRFYSLPVDSNYNADLSQEDLPSTAQRLRTPGMPRNGDNTLLQINKTIEGGVNGLDIVSSPETFKVGNTFVVNDIGTEGSGAAATVTSVTGKTVSSVNSSSLDPTNAFGVSLIQTISSCYLFENDTITQEGSDFTGRVIGNISNQNSFVIDRVTGTYEEGNSLNSSSNIISILLSGNATFTKDFTLLLTDGDDDTIATGRILESVFNQNSVRVEVLTGEFLVPETATRNYFLQSTRLGDSVGLEVITYTALSKNLQPFAINSNVALLETTEPHNVGANSAVTIDITPDVDLTTTDYYVRKRFYQEVTLRAPSFASILVDTGIGRVEQLNGGVGYLSQTYTDVELIFFDQSKVRNGIGAVGDPDNARATIVVSDFNGTGYGSVSVVTITNKGKNYIKGDILTVADSSLNRLDSIQSTQRLALDVDHVGFAQKNTEMFLRAVNTLSINDYVLIDSEVVKITAINDSARSVTVERGQFNTIVRDHFNGARITSYNGVYRFNANSRPLGEGINDPYVISYDESTQKVVLAYNYNATNPRQVTNSSIFQDDSSPRKSIAISSTKSGENKLEFSKDENFASYGVNQDIRIQKYYRYSFDTSHPSMNGVFLDFSASRTGSIFTEEKEVSGIQPGNPGSYVAITLGFGPDIVGAEQQKYPVNFDTYYYFIKASSDVNTENAALKVIDDPLVGPKKVLFTTPTKFVYQIPETPDYEGTGEITYTTSSPFAEGRINTTSINNLGSGYKRLPVLMGCRVSNNNEPTLETQIDSITGSIVGVSVINGGKNYINPKAMIVIGDGSGAMFDVYSENGVIRRIDVLNGGSGYTFATVAVYESSVQGYFTSSTIGVPQDVSIISNGGSFHSDETLRSTYRSNYALLIKGTDRFFKGERVEQKVGNTVIFSAVVSNKGWRTGSNILRLNKITGVIDLNLPLKASNNENRSVEVADVLYTEFSSDVRTYYDNVGRYASDKGKIGSRYQKITDSYFYQDFSYVIQSRTSIEVWRDLIKQTTHPAGFQLFGEVLIDSEQEASMPTGQTPTTSISYIELAPKTVTVERKSTKITNSFVSVADTNLIRGQGSISIDEYDTEGIIARELTILEPFTGRYATKEDFVGSIRAISKPGSDSEIRAAFIGVGGSLFANGSEYGHWIKFKMVSNSRNQPAVGPFLGQNGPASPAQAWDINDNYTILPNDEYKTTGSGVFDLTQITSMQIGYLFDFGNFRQGNLTDLTDYEFGAYIESPESDFSQITSGFEVGDQITFYENAASYITVEVVSVDAPAYDSVEGVIGNGNILGRKTFTLVDKANNLSYSPYNEQELFLTLNGVAQEPGKSFKVSGSQITFSEPPLGPLFPQTGENLDDTYETDPAKLICKAFKFKEDTYNSRYLKKLKDISPKFDGIADQFDLYWEDGSIVKADPGEKFLIFINGILQEAKESPEAPLGNAYYILRRSNPAEPDAVVFSEPPRNFADDIDVVPVQLDQRESFFGYGVGSYDRFKIDDRLIPYRGTGPYLIFGEVDGRVKNITDDRFVMVFVDGVLQDPDSYRLNGPNITFTSNITRYVPETGKPVQNNVRLISLYGRDVPKTLSFYDYDRVGLTNEVIVRCQRVIDTSAGNAEYDDFQSRLYSFNPSTPKNVFTITSDGTRKLLGKLSQVRFDLLEDGTANGSSKTGVTAVDFKFTLLNAANLDFSELSYNPNEHTADDTRVSAIYVSDKADFSDPISFNNINKNFSIDISYPVDDEGKRLLARDLPEWLRGSENGNSVYNIRNNTELEIIAGDEILVDGENEFRTIQYVPGKANLRNFGLGQTAKYEHFSKVDVTNYNGLVRGEGLSVTSQIDGTGRVVSLGFNDLEWNKRDLALFFNTGILLQPTAYQYFVPPQLKFVPVDGNGGGARAEVLTKDGQVLDVVLTNGGFGYTQPPKVVVTRGYIVKRNARRVINSQTVISVNSEVVGGGALSVVQTEILLFGEGAVSSVLSIIALGGLAGDQVDSDSVFVTEIHTTARDAGTGLKRAEYYQFTKREAFGAFDQRAADLDINELQITVTIDSPTAVITDISPEMGVDVITQTLHKQINAPIVYAAQDTYSVTGAFLDAPLSPTATTAYIANTSLFPSQGKLQIGREIVAYNSTLGDRFLDLTRGIEGTTAQAHPGGQYLRTLPEFVTVLPVGPATILITESEVRMSSAQLVELKSQVISEQEIKQSDDRYIEIENEFQILTPDVTPVIEVGIKSIAAPAQETVASSPETIIVVTNTVTHESEVRMLDERFIQSTRNLDLDLYFDYDITKQITIIPPTTVLDAEQSAASDSKVTQINASLETISSDIVTIASTTTITEVDVHINIELGLQTQTEITKFEGFKTVSAISSVSGNVTSEIYAAAQPAKASMNALLTNTVSRVIVTPDSITALVDFPRGADGGVLGGQSEDGPKQIQNRLDLAIIATLTTIESIAITAGPSITSTYSVRSHLPVHEGRDKPADVMLQREMGILDYYTELVVLETTIRTRN